MRILAIAAALTCVAAQVASAETPAPTHQVSAGQSAASAEIVRPDVTMMSGTEIRSFNATLASSKHPYFIVCRQSAVTGSLAKRTRICKTREDWERSIRESQADADRLIGGGRASPGCDPYCLENQPRSAGTPQ